MINHSDIPALHLTSSPISIVKIAFIGLGNRGMSTLQRYIQIEGVGIKALCDVDCDKIARAEDILKKANLPFAQGYGKKDEWKRMCERNDIDIIFICTDWLTHTIMARYAMEHGKHVAIEVPAAMSIDECWQLVFTAEKTRRHCFMLENCCYDPFALLTLNMARCNAFGEIMHVEGAYIHDLRDKFYADENEGGYYNHWEKEYCVKHNGNPYPTHGLGPLCKILNIHHGDRMEYLVSMSTKSAGMTDYAIRKYGENSVEAKRQYLLGDVNTTLIHTVKGKEIMIQYSVVSPRPYSRLHTICGTHGFAQKYPVPCIALDPNANEPLNGKELEDIEIRYEHPFTTTFGKESRKKGIANEMNYVMDHRLIYCLHHGLPLDIDVYDAAEWSCITELSELSVSKGSTPVKIPDFTRGHWEK